MAINYEEISKNFKYDIDDLASDSELVKKAALFAFDAHGKQKRKYTNEPYIEHPIEVARTVKSYLNDEEAICAALLHDVVEDTNKTLHDISKEFGDKVAELVKNLTDAEEGNRKERKEKAKIRLKESCYKTKTIKLGDILSNTPSITKHDKNFAKVYLKEVEELMQVLQDGNAQLFDLAYRSLMSCKLHVFPFRED